LVAGILVLIDALGTQENDQEKLKEKVHNFDLVDERIKNNISILGQKLENAGYKSMISSGFIYDNFQIFLPIDINFPAYVDMTGKNEWYWNLIVIGNFLIDIFRYALSLNIPLRGCITSGHGEKTKTNRILGPIANEASRYYELTNWIGVIVTNHPGIVLNNKVKINPNPELFEPYIKYKVPVKELILDNSRCASAYRLEYRSEEYWSLRWPMPQGFERREMDRCFVAVPSNKTEYGDFIPDETILQVINNGVNHEDTGIAEKWKNTLNFFKSVKNS
jgi:hypothetical protein